MGLISDEDIERIRDAVDIVEIISASMPLKRAGGSFSALCPFHSEKTPSFRVFPQSQLFKCFGCGASGTVFTFLMKLEKMEFHEAVRALADRAGITIAQDDPIAAKKRTDLYSALDSAISIYHANLINPATQASEQALKYLTETRGLKEMIIRQHKLGFAPDAPDGWEFLLKKISCEYSQELLETAGLIKMSSSSRQYYDAFRNRIMIPIYDARGRPVGFGARTLDPEFKTKEIPKFINSKESPIFTKGKILYLIHTLRQQNYERTPLLVVEGYFDALFLHQEGFTNTVSPIGTSLTLEQAILLKKYTDRAMLCFDPDEAGARAAIKSSENLLQADLRFDVITLPEGKDPDEFLIKNGRQAFQHRIEQAKPLFEFSLETLLAGREFRYTDDKIEFLKEISPMLNSVADSITSAAYCSRLADLLGLHYEAVVNAVNKKSLNNGITITPLPSAETEYQIALCLIHKPAFRTIFGQQLSEEQFKNQEIKILFLYLTSPDALEQKRKSPELFGQAHPLFASMFTEDLPKEIISFAQIKNIPADEGRIRALVSELIRTPVSDTPSYLLLERFQEETFAGRIEEDYERKDGGEIKKTIDKHMK